MVFEQAEPEIMAAAIEMLDGMRTDDAMDQQDADFPMSPEQERTLNEVLIPAWKEAAKADGIKTDPTEELPI